MDSCCIIQPNFHNKGGLFLGNLKGANNNKELKADKIKAVLSVSKNDLNYGKAKIQHLTIEADDLPVYNIRESFEKSIRFITK